MTPQQLRPGLFAAYPPAGRLFATQYLTLLQRLPLAVCPSFLREIQRLSTSFPVEVDSLRLRCEFLQALGAAPFTERTEKLRQLHLSLELEGMDWVNDPARFIAALTAYLWSSDQIDAFRSGSELLFSSMPSHDADVSRLTIVLAGAGTYQPHGDLFRKLRSRGLLFTGLDATTMPAQIEDIFNAHAATVMQPYANWYVDGEPLPGLSLAAQTISVSYRQLEPLRLSALSHMEAFIKRGKGGAEEMRSSLSGLAPADLNATNITRDPVLQRFYTELFTGSSGPQIFSTSFVQWTGRELARRARPRTMLLRYGPRQRQRNFDELIQRAGENSLDPEGALRDAEMGAYYNFLEMDRITMPGKGVFLVWIEGTSAAILIASGTPAGTRSETPISLKSALQEFS
jgi:hypothetical protein